MVGFVCSPHPFPAVKAQLDAADSQRSGQWGGGREEGINLCIIKHEMGNVSLALCGLPIISVHETTVQVLGFLLGKVRNSKSVRAEVTAVLQVWPAGMTSERTFPTSLRIWSWISPYSQWGRGLNNDSVVIFIFFKKRENKSIFLFVTDVKKS